jgi:hypothetical protein
MRAGVAVGVGLLVVLIVDAVTVLVAAGKGGTGGEQQDAGGNLAGAAHVRTYDRAQRCSAQEKNKWHGIMQYAEKGRADDGP